MASRDSAYGLAALLILAAALVPATAADTVSPVKDAATTARIETLFLFNRHLSPFDINTNTSNGIVTLSGGVRDEIQKDLAGELAATVQSVTQVINTITVVPSVPTLIPKRNLRQRVEDRSVNASVRTRLLYHKQLKGLKIGVRTFNGAVTLSGVVTTPEQKQRIGEIAYETRGVENIVNNLTVRPRERTGRIQNIGQQVSDEWVEKRVETSIALNRHLSIRRVDVEVNDSVCILTGTVDTEPERTLAGSIAQNIMGVESVVNDIRVRKIPALSLELFEPLEDTAEKGETAPISPARPGEIPLVSSTPLTP